MKTTKPTSTKTTTSTKTIDRYPGTAVNRADDDKTTPCLEKQETRILNNNPRNNDM